MTAYNDFLQKKIKTVADAGFDVAELNKHLFDFQQHIVRKALKKGRYAIFADCGLGKTLMQLEWAHRVVTHTNLPVIVLAPLAVTGQTIQEGAKFGIDVIEWVDGMESLHEIPPAIYIINYEQLEKLIAILGAFGGVVLDESSILKNFEGATRTLIIECFADTPYKLACTATPSPNDPMELGNHSEFLNVMGRNEMLAMYFVHDGGDTAKWRLKGHSEKSFWQWVSSWAIMLSKPSDIGFSAEGYDLPPLNFIERMIETPKRNNGSLFNDVAVSATNFNSELRQSMALRFEAALEILLSKPDEQFIVWVKQNEEAEVMMAKCQRHGIDAVEVAGSHSPEYKKKHLLGFANGAFRVLVTKTKIAQYGLNYQNCHNQIFPSLDFSFEGLYQAIRRSYRFGQEYGVNIYIISTDTMRNVLQSIKTKQTQFESMQANMQQSMNESFESELMAKETGRIEHTKSATLYLGDCVTTISQVPDESIGLSVFSPPFAELYTYSDNLEDMGNSKDYQEFLFAFNFLVKELFRVMWSGRNVAVHCMDLPIQKGKEGYIGLRDFSNMIRTAFEGAGFIYHSRVTIWKDPVVEMQRTKALGLLHKQVKKDAAMSRVGLPDYVLVFRKPGEHVHPVKCDIPVDLWQKYASPVWYDIDYGKTLNGRAGRDEKDEKHICPLQLDTIERCIHLWSNEGDTVLSPFMGIGSEVFQAVKMKRRGVGIELKQSYYELAIKNVLAAEATHLQSQFSFS